ncbi:MAG: malate dehydrogenase [Nitrospirae bacterium]|nr:malate dehydrogenase [Nitrospirota bacterium]
MKTRITIIGAGNVGATTAELIARDGLADVVLFDIHEGIAKGKALDMTEACPLWNSPSTVTGTNIFEETAESDIIIITAGFPRKPGMSRDDLLHANAEVITSVTEGTVAYSPGSIIIVVTNPMDVMAYAAMKVSGFPGQRVIGMGGVLDSSRFRTFVAKEFGVSAEDVEALVLGGHGDQMVPLPRFTTVKGIPIPELIGNDRIAQLIERTRNGGAEIVGLLKTGSAYYAPAASAVQMAKSILFDEKRLLPCSAHLDGQYGISGIFLGVPAILGKSGIEKIVDLHLTEEELAMFHKSASAVKSMIETLKPA